MKSNISNFSFEIGASKFGVMHCNFFLHFPGLEDHEWRGDHSNCEKNTSANLNCDKKPSADSNCLEDNAEEAEDRMTGQT